MAIAQKIKVAELREFAKTLPEGKREEIFIFLDRRYDIVKAKFLIKQLDLKPVEAKVEDLAAKTYLDYPKGTKSAPILAINVDDRYIEEHFGTEDKVIDLNEPLIFAVSSFGRGKDKSLGSILIDGNHRVRKAFLLGVETLQAYVLSEAVTKRVESRR